MGYPFPRTTSLCVDKRKTKPAVYKSRDASKVKVQLTQTWGNYYYERHHLWHPSHKNLAALITANQLAGNDLRIQNLVVWDDPISWSQTFKLNRTLLLLYNFNPVRVIDEFCAQIAFPKMYIGLNILHQYTKTSHLKLQKSLIPGTS